MQTHREALGGDYLHGNHNYAGEVVDDCYKILLARNRDSNCLQESNWDVALKELGGESEDLEDGSKPAVIIVRFGSWACGWFEYLMVLEGTPEFAIAEKIEKQLESYSILDDDDFSRREMEAADEIWKNWWRVKDRIKYIRDNRSNMEFRDFKELISCVRGECFRGDASDILSS